MSKTVEELKKIVPEGGRASNSESESIPIVIPDFFLITFVAVTLESLNP